MQHFTRLNTTLAAIGLFMACSSASAQGFVSNQVAAMKSQVASLQCKASMDQAKSAFGAALAQGVQSGKLDTKVRADLEAKHAALLKKEAAALADGKLTQAECDSITADIKAEHDALVKAMPGAPAKPAAPVSTPAAPASKPVVPATVTSRTEKHPAPVTPSAATCTTEDLAKANAGFGAVLAAGVKSGKIDAKEKADLEARHVALMKKEAAAKADGKLTAAECHGILADIRAEHIAMDKALASATAKPVAPVAKPAASAPAKK